MFHLNTYVRAHAGPGAFVAHTIKRGKGHSILVMLQVSCLLVCNSPLEDGSCLLWHEVQDLQVPQCSHGCVMFFIRAMGAREQVLQRLHRAHCHFEQAASVPHSREGRGGREGREGNEGEGRGGRGMEGREGNGGERRWR